MFNRNSLVAVLSAACQGPVGRRAGAAVVVSGGATLPEAV